MVRLVKSFGHAFRGIGAAAASERNLLIHLLAVMVVVAAGFYFSVSAFEWTALVLCFGTVITAELINTAIEKTIDLVSPSHNEKAGKIKDIAAGAVLVSAIAAVVIALIIFIPKLFW